MDMTGVMAAGLERIDPQAVEAGLAVQIEGQFPNEFLRMLIEQAAKIGKGRIAPR